MFSLKLFDLSTNEPFFPNFTKKKDINRESLNYPFFVLKNLRGN